MLLSYVLRFLFPFTLPIISLFTLCSLFGIPLLGVYATPVYVACAAPVYVAYSFPVYVTCSVPVSPLLLFYVPFSGECSTYCSSVYSVSYLESYSFCLLLLLCFLSVCDDLMLYIELDYPNGSIIDSICL
jgi:hypothetical protein